MEREMLINLSLLFLTLCFLIFYKLFRQVPKKKGSSYSELYQKILNSEEYKVKGQYED